MNKHRAWQLIFFVMTVFFALLYYYGDPQNWKICLISMTICLYIMLKIEDYYDKIQASKYVTAWLFDERILNLLQNSSYSDFIFKFRTYSGLKSDSLHVKLLKEYLDNRKIKTKFIKLAIEKYYTDKALEGKKLADKAAYQELKDRIEDKL